MSPLDLPTTIQNNIAIVLIAPDNNQNIGMVLRAASNFGFSDIRLVNAKSYDPDKAKYTACWGSDLIYSIKQFDQLADAVSDCQQVVGLTSTFGHHRPPTLTIKQWQEQTNFDQKIALLFGPEDTGLTREHFPFCSYLIRIPTATENPSLNLAQAVLLTLYELAQQPVINSDYQAVTQSELVPLFNMIKAVGEKSDFYNQYTSKQIPEKINNLFQRANLSLDERNLLVGYLGLIDKKLTKP